MTKKPRNEHQHRAHGGETANHHHGSTAEETAALNETLKTFSKKYYEPDEKAERRERIKFRIEVGVAIGVAFNIALTLGLLIVGALQSYYSSQQVTASQGQLAVSQDQERRQLRAYIGVVPGEVEDFGDAPKQRFHLTRKNYGLTPAYDVGFSNVTSRLVKVGTPIGDVPGSGGLCANANARPGLAGLVTMFPSVELPFTVTGTQAFTNEEIQSVRLGTYQMVYLGDVCYNDAFGAVHYTNYCWMFRGQSMTAKDADGCLTHNDSN